MDFIIFIGDAWNDHAGDPAEVARRLDDGLRLVTDEDQLNQLMTLGHHLYGDHLGQWHEGMAFIERLSAQPVFAAEGASGQSGRRCLASLRVAAGDEVAFDVLATSDRVRVGAMAAANLCDHDTVRAHRLLQEALDLAERSGLPAGDPMHRALAIAGNNLASSLEQKPARSTDERALMILAAQAACRHWSIAGTWLEVERAEYRLANTWLQAGDVDRAREHAQACLAIVDANGGAALERLFGWAALGLVERAAGHAQGHAQALARAREAFDALDADDKGWCAETIDKLTAPTV